MTKQTDFKFAYIYTDGGYRVHDNIPGTGIGVHGYFFDKLESVRIAKVPVLVTPEGYQPKPTGKQQKDPKYNPPYNGFDLSINYKDGSVLKEGSGIQILDGIMGIAEGTNNIGEMEAFIKLFREAPLKAEKYVVRSDSMTLVRGWNKDMHKWKKNEWRKGDGTPPKNLDLWHKIYELWEEMHERIELEWIKAHDGHYGNETADRNATYGVIGSVNRYYEMTWIVNDIHDNDYWEPSKPIPPLLRWKWSYALSETPRETYEIDGEKYWHYLIGDHTKNPDDLHLIGKALSDAGFAVVAYKDHIEKMDAIKAYHVGNMWETDNVMYQSEVLNMINIANVSKPKALWELNNIPLQYLWFENHHNDIVSEKADLLSTVNRPPKLSYRILDEERSMREVLFTYIRSQGKEIKHEGNHIDVTGLCVNDITDLIYEKTFKKNGDPDKPKISHFYDMVDKSLEFTVKQPCNNREIKLIMSRNINLPDRNVLSGIAGDNPKISVVTWGFSKRAFRYGTIVETDNGVGLWTGPYSNIRALNDGEIIPAP